MFEVNVLFGETRAAKHERGCALEAARLFSERPLKVLVVSDPDCGAIYGGLSKHCADGTQELRARSSIERDCGRLMPVVVQRQCSEEPNPPPDTLFVSRMLGHRRRNFHVLDPAHERSLSQRGAGPILMPFSDGETGLIVARIAFEMAERARAAGASVEDGTPEVLLYHTTWSDPTAVSGDAIDHMCEDAVRVMLALEQEATRRGIRFRTIVETHDDVVQGVIEIAQATNSSLIAVARGARIRHGSYVERTLEQSPMPVLVVADGTKRLCEPASDAQLIEFRRQRAALASVKNAAAQNIELRTWRDCVRERLPVVGKPMFAVGVGAVSYLVKAIAKIAIGCAIASPMVTGDGFHNLADLLQTGALALAVLIAARPTNGRYPWGRRNVEWMTQLTIGILLFVAAGKFIYDCVLGGLSFWPAGDAWLRSVFPSLPEPEVLHLTGQTFPIVLIITLGSFISSILVSRYQIAVGRRHASASLIAAGEEMRSDGWIELVTVIGILVQYFTGWRFLEYPLGLLVACMIIHTGWELTQRGWRVLLQHSLGEEVEKSIHEACMRVNGVEGVAQLKTFQTGDTAVVIVTVESLAAALTLHYVKKAIEHAISARLLVPGAEFNSTDVHVTMQRPAPKRHRIGYPLIDWQGRLLIALDLQSATHVAVCDIEHGDPVRTKVLPLGKDPVATLLDKRISKVYAFAPDVSKAEQLRARARILLGAKADNGVIPLPALVESTCYVPAACGVML